ncbi:hypothetical protein FJY94_05235 [Candidatus Kaiserbacteria bacterium]|nr:hypothetical protein [Candidatus Kaiserbacteria bacterium]
MSPASRLFGYARVSTGDQDLSRQIDALQQHGMHHRQGTPHLTELAAKSGMAPTPCLPRTFRDQPVARRSVIHELSGRRLQTEADGVGSLPVGTDTSSQRSLRMPPRAAQFPPRRARTVRR